MLDIEEFKKKLDKKSRLMGIDPGRKRIGVAISDENKIIATPYTTLIKNKYSEFLKEIIKIHSSTNHLLSSVQFGTVRCNFLRERQQIDVILKEPWLQSFIYFIRTC